MILEFVFDDGQVVWWQPPGEMDTELSAELREQLRIGLHPTLNMFFLVLCGVLREGDTAGVQDLNARLTEAARAGVARVQVKRRWFP